MFTAFRGKPLAEALRSYGDPALIAEFDSLCAQENEIVASVGRSHPDATNYRQKVLDAKSAAEAAFVRRLSSGALMATGFQMPLKASSMPELLSSDLWPLFEVDFDLSRVRAHNLAFAEVHVLKPMFVTHRSKPPPAPRPEFEASPDFLKVRMRDCHFDLGLKQSRVVRALARVATHEDPWLEGKAVMIDAESDSLKIGDLFKNTEQWKELIEGNGAGGYRLNLKTTHRIQDPTTI